MVKQHEGESIIETLNADEVEQQRRYLAEVGARPSDVFGADNILWVEGPTEEECFPKILEYVANRSLMGTVIRGLPHTGDLEGKHDELVFKIYNQLSHSKSLLPPAIGFILDDEGRPEQRKQELRHRSNKLAHFLPRLMYENYLLNPAAVAGVANGIEGFRDSPISEEEVSITLEQKRQMPKYFRPLELNIQQLGEAWISAIHGAKVLQDIFSELSQTRVAFDKRIHSLALTEWLIEHSPQDLKEIAELITMVLEKSASSDELNQLSSSDAKQQITEKHAVAKEAL